MGLCVASIANPFLEESLEKKSKLRQDVMANVTFLEKFEVTANNVDIKDVSMLVWIQLIF